MASAIVGVSHMVVPLCDRDLARPDRGAEPVAVFHDLEKVAPLDVLERCQSPVIDDQHVHPCEAGEEPLVGTVGSGEL